jgi:hypothetical protein
MSALVKFVFARVNGPHRTIGSLYWDNPGDHSPAIIHRADSPLGSVVFMVEGGAR